MKKLLISITFFILGMTNYAQSATIAPYLQDSDAKVKYALVRREAYNVLIMAQDALNRESQKDMQSALKQLDTVRSKLKNVLALPAYTNVYQNFTQSTRDREDMELYVQKIDALRAQLTKALDEFKVKPVGIISK